MTTKTSALTNSSCRESRGAVSPCQSKTKNSSLVIGRRDDATVPFYFSEDLHEAIEGSELIIVEEGGHYSFRRHADEWAAHIRPFLEKWEDKI